MLWPPASHPRVIGSIRAVLLRTGESDLNWRFMKRVGFQFSRALAVAAIRSLQLLPKANNDAAKEKSNVTEVLSVVSAVKNRLHKIYHSRSRCYMRRCSACCSVLSFAMSGMKRSYLMLLKLMGTRLRSNRDLLMQLIRAQGEVFCSVDNRF